MSPIFLSYPGVLSHNAIVNCSPHRQDITFEDIFGDSWNSFQEIFLSGKRELNVVENDLLELVKFYQCMNVKQHPPFCFVPLGFQWLAVVKFGARVGVLLGL